MFNFYAIIVQNQGRDVIKGAYVSIVAGRVAIWGEHGRPGASTMNGIKLATFKRSNCILLQILYPQALRSGGLELKTASMINTKSLTEQKLQM